MSSEFTTLSLLLYSLALVGVFAFPIVRQRVPRIAVAMLVAIPWAAALFAGALTPETSDGPCITVEDIRTAQSAWGNALVHIGDEWRRDGCRGARAAAEAAFDAAYKLPLLFKPTVAANPPSRHTRDGALSYFVGQCAPRPFPDDIGFALGPLAGEIDDNSTWLGYKSAHFHDFEYLVGGDYCYAAVAEGQLTLTSNTDKTSTVDKTFVYAPASTGLRARIVAHHSSTIIV